MELVWHSLNSKTSKIGKLVKYYSIAYCLEIGTLKNFENTNEKVCLIFGSSTSLDIRAGFKSSRITMSLVRVLCDQNAHFGHQTPLK